MQSNGRTACAFSSDEEIVPCLKNATRAKSAKALHARALAKRAPRGEHEVEIRTVRRSGGQREEESLRAAGRKGRKDPERAGAGAVDPV